MVRAIMLVVPLLLRGGPLRGSDLQFAADGRPNDLRLRADGDNRVEASVPGGFVVKVFAGADTKETRLFRVGGGVRGVAEYVGARALLPGRARCTAGPGS